jgi:hypothetical protein
MVLAPARMLSRRAAFVFGVSDLVTATLIGVGVFVALPVRWAPVDAVAGVLAALELASCAALWIRARWAARIASVTATAALGVGLALVTSLAWTASWLSGVYGSVGRGGAIILVLVAALALPYLVVLPVVKLFWLAPLGRRRIEP